MDQVYMINDIFTGVTTKAVDKKSFVQQYIQRKTISMVCIVRFL